MLARRPGSPARCALVLLLAGAAPAQEPVEIAGPLQRLGSASAADRARARESILRLGAPGLEALRSAIDADRGMLPEHLFVLAEAIGRERRGVRFVQRADTGHKSWHVAWCPDGRRLAILDRFGGPVRILDGELQPTGESFGDDAAYFALDPTGKTVAYDRGKGEVAIADVSAGVRARIAVTDRPSLAYSPDGRFLATGGYGLAVDLYGVADGKPVRRFVVDGSKGGLTPVFSPDGTLLVVGNRNDTTHVFDVATGDLRSVLDRKMTQEPAFSPDGKRLAIGYVDGTIAVWDVATGALVKSMASGIEEVFALAWSPDGRFLASAGLGGPVTVWSGEFLARLHTLDSGSQRTFSLCFRPDGELLVAAGNETTRTWVVEEPR